MTFHLNVREIYLRDIFSDDIIGIYVKLVMILTNNLCFFFSPAMPVALGLKPPQPRPVAGLRRRRPIVNRQDFT